MLHLHALGVTQFLDTVDRIFERHFRIHLVRPKLVYLQKAMEIRVLKKTWVSMRVQYPKTVRMHLVSFSLWLISLDLLDEQRVTIGSNQPLLIQLWRNLSTLSLPVTRLALCFVLASASNCPCFRTTCQGLTRAQVACISNRHPRRPCRGACVDV